LIHWLWGGARNPQINEALANWCAVHIGLKPFVPHYTTLGVFDDQELIAVILYNNYHPDAGVIEMHGAATSSRWLTRPVLWEMFSYPFLQLGCQLVAMRVSERDNRLKRILGAYGFEHVTIPRLRGRDEAERIYWLTDDAWKANGFHKEYQ
jgi:RimJ/RimL family protein N-acetyltransferase